jgi:hypothetical protein
LKRVLGDAVWPTLLAALLFIGSLNGRLISDDMRILVDQPRVSITPRQAFTTDVWNGYPPGWHNRQYRPLALLTYAAIYRLVGAEYWVFHAANVLLNAAATGAFFFLLTGLRFPRRICLAASLLFAVHPLHVEAVAWIAGMMETLGGALVLASLACFAYRRRFWSLSLAALALLAKESAMALLPMIFAIEFWRCWRQQPSSPGRMWRSAAWSALPYLPLAIAYSLARAFVVGRAPPGLLRDALLAGPGTWPGVTELYAGLLFVPWPLVATYAEPSALKCVVVLSLIGLSLLAIWHFRKTAGDLLLAAALAAAALALPVLAAPLMTDWLTVQDRYAYLATAGACLFAVVLIDLIPALPKGRAVLFGCMLLVPLGALGTCLQIPVWQSEETMWSHSLELVPNATRASVGLALQLGLAKRFSEEAAVLRRALHYDPLSPGLRRAYNYALQRSLEKPVVK